METMTHIRKERQYYIDWLRILLIISVFLFHIGMIFNTWDWHVKNDQTYGGTLKYIMSFLHEWRMPLLFLISGAGTFFALGKRSPGQYLGERFKRLFIPLLIGIFILVPVQVYIEKSALYDSLSDFYPHMFEGIYPAGNFSWHHLWFIAYLFVIALIITPVLLLVRTRLFGKMMRMLEKVASKPLGLNVFMVPLLLSQVLLRPFFPDNTHGLVDDWAFMAYFLIFFMAGFTLLSNPEITQSIRKQRWLFFAESAVFTTLLFTVPFHVTSEEAANTFWDVLSIFVAWSCGLTAIGFARQHLNRDHRLRKPFNEAIYPFYLLHQPVIVMVASVVTRWDLAAGWKALIITIFSLLVVVIIYLLVIHPFNFLRVAFGMKPQRKETRNELQPTPAVIRVRELLTK